MIRASSRLTDLDIPIRAKENVGAIEGAVLEPIRGEMRKTFEDLCQSAKASRLVAETHLSKYSCQLDLGEEMRRLRDVGERDRHVLKHGIVCALIAEAL